MHVQTLIIGAGPGGLACARILAEHGKEVLVLERKKTIGPKVCAGGITWSGLISRVPEELAEKSFPTQHIRTPWQRVRIEEEMPIIATINREKLGQQMACQAVQAGAVIRTATVVRTIKERTVLVQDRNSGKKEEISFDYLVGADGSSSLVRRHLGLPSRCLGIGINYQIPGNLKRMEWHLNNHLFGNGYAWIFPHSDTVSIGAYADKETRGPSALKASLLSWAASQGFALDGHRARAEYINYDFQGWNFGHTFLIGDAAGLASGLTGEGIYPAIVSGEQAALTIADPTHSNTAMEKLITNHARHSRMVRLSAKNGFLNGLLAELVTLGLRSGMVKFNKLEMAV